MALNSNHSTPAPYDVGFAQHFGVVDQREGINERILCHLKSIKRIFVRKTDELKVAALKAYVKS